MAGGVRELDVCSCRVRTCFVYVIKLPCYSVQIYECIPGIYVIGLNIFYFVTNRASPIQRR